MRSFHCLTLTIQAMLKFINRDGRVLGNTVVLRAFLNDLLHWDGLVCYRWLDGFCRCISFALSDPIT